MDLAESNASEVRYKKKHSDWQADHDDIVKSLAKSSASLNQFEIQQLMFNRFDATIVKLVDKANKDWGDSGDPLDPNIVKSILFRETQMGTSGAFMDDTSSWRPHHVMNHWNITQAIDSSGEMYARYFLEQDRARRDKFKLASILTDKVRVEKERDRLATLPRRTPAQQARLDELVDLTHLDGKPNSENFFWRYPGMWDAITDLWKSENPPLNNTYEHWIYMLLFELFQKRRGAKDWSEAVQRYNGSGTDAENYRKEVTKRVAGALEAQKLGKPYVPHHDKDPRK
jgi:hypothetical protein